MHFGGVLPALHSLEYRVHTRVVVTVLVVLLVTASVLAEPPHRTLVREAAAAQRSGDLALAIAKYESAVALRADYPRVLLSLARLYTAADRPEDAIARLRTLADMGLAFGVKDDSAFAALAGLAGFQSVAGQFARNTLQRGIASPKFQLAGQAGLIESAALRTETDEWFFGDVHQRCVWRRTPDGQLAKFPDHQDQPGGVFAVLVDEDRGALWLSTSSLPQVRGHTAAAAGHATLREYDLGTGRLRRSVTLPPRTEGRVVGSLALAADGTLYATDSVAPEIWRLDAGATAARLFLSHPDFVSLQGLALVEGDRTLIVADYANGLWRIDTATGRAALVPPPEQTTLFGIDGLTAAPEGLVAVQNGVNPQRLLLLRLDDAGRIASLEVLAAAQPGLDDLATGTVVDGRAYVVAASGWSRFDDPAAPPAPHTVMIFQTPLN